MNKQWQRALLGEITREDREQVGTIDGNGLPVLGVTNVDGVTHTGIEASSDKSKYLRLRSGRFVYNPYRINVGSIGLSSIDQDGICSPAYIVFVPTAEIDSKFLLYFLKSAWGNQLINFHGNRGTVRSALRFDDLSKIEISYPVPDEQRRIVVRIEEIVGRIEEARSLCRQSVAEEESLLAAMAHRADLDSAAKERAGWTRKHLSEVMKLVSDVHKVKVDRAYNNLGIYSFGRGLFLKPPLDGMISKATALHRVKAGQFIYSRLFAFEGAYGMVRPEFDGFFVSQEYPTFDCDPLLARAEFLVAYFKPSHIWKTVAVGSKGLGDRRQRVQPAQILAHELWVPPISYQDRIAEVQSHIDTLTKLQEETSKELDAMLPSILDKAFKGEL